MQVNFAVVSGPVVVPVAHLDGCDAVVSGPLVVPVAELKVGESRIGPFGGSGGSSED